MNCEPRNKKAFTLIELVVAIGVLALMVSFSGAIFKMSIESYRVAGAHADIMQKLRAITDQLNADFKGLRKDTPLLIWFQEDPNDPDQRYDQIMLIANGDFQSTQLYDGSDGFKVPELSGKPVIGNVARVYYGQAMAFAPTVGNFLQPWQQDEENAPDRMLNKRNRILARRQHILSADSSLFKFPDATNFIGSYIPADNDRFEHDSISLSEWKVISNNLNYNNQIIGTCLGDTGRPAIDLHNAGGLYMLMAQHVSSFSVQWAYYSEEDGWGELRWWPSYLHFAGMGLADFGIYFNMPGGVDPALGWYGPESAVNESEPFDPLFTPEALKFTFTLYDSKGIIKNGRTFTHIVYLEN